ncbi:MAG: efflux RND transporter periplasmic adaptor subunit, partial [Thermodesulfobacteriota bacterium]
MINTASNLFFSIIFIIGVSIFALFGCRGEKVEESTPIVRPAKTMVVGFAEGLGRTYPGKVQASQRVNLSFRVSGPLIEFPVNEGDEVVKGQLLARIDPRDYRIALDEAKATYNKTQADYIRYRDLYERDAVPLAELDLKRAQRDTAKAKLEKAEADLQDTNLKAPFSGRIGEKIVDNFQEVRAKQDVVSLHDVSNVEIVIDLPESVIATAEKGTISKLAATFESAPGVEFPLEVKEVSAQADPTTQTYRATLTMPQPEDIFILPGMTANVVVESKNIEDNAIPTFVIPA